MILTPLQKLPNNVGDLCKIIVATGFEWLPSVTPSLNKFQMKTGYDVKGLKFCIVFWPFHLLHGSIPPFVRWGMMDLGIVARVFISL